MVATPERFTHGTTTALAGPSTWLRVHHATERTGPVDQWERYPTAIALLDGPMWGNRNVEGSAGRALFSALDVAARVEHGSQRPSEGITLAVDAAGEVTARRGGTWPEGSRVAVQGWPPLVWQGRAVGTNVGTNGERVPRAAVAVLADGRIALCASRAVDVARFSAELVALGASAAAYTDGGSSTYLGTRDGVIVSAPDPRVFTWLRLDPSTPGVADGGDGAEWLFLLGIAGALTLGRRT